MDYGHSIDEWAEDTEDDFCDACDDWTDDDGHGNCKACGIKYKSVDPYISPAVATAYSSDAPSVSASGDLYGRTSGYTWGSGGSWWNRGVSDMTSMWRHSSSQSDKKTRMLKHKRHLDSLCKVDNLVSLLVIVSNATANVTNIKTNINVVSKAAPF